MLNNVVSENQGLACSSQDKRRSTDHGPTVGKAAEGTAGKAEEGKEARETELRVLAPHIIRGPLVTCGFLLCHPNWAMPGKRRKGPSL